MLILEQTTKEKLRLLKKKKKQPHTVDVDKGLRNNQTSTLLSFFSGFNEQKNTYTHRDPANAAI